MLAPLQELSIEGPEAEERRRLPRTPGGPPVSLVMAGRDPCAATVSDVSLYGCCVESAADWLRPGRFVGVALDGSEPLPCLVRWTCGSLAGLELLQRLPAERHDWHDLID